MYYEAYNRRDDVKGRSRERHIRLAAAARQSRQTNPISHSYDCSLCGKSFTSQTKRSPNRKHFCSAFCREKSRKKTRNIYLSTWSRARALKLKEVTIDNIQPLDIFIRDNWTCWLCSGICSQDAEHMAPDEPTIDHVVALSKGGFHTSENVKTAHRQCNTRKNAREVQPGSFTPPDPSVSSTPRIRRPKQRRCQRCASPFHFKLITAPKCRVAVARLRDCKGCSAPVQSGSSGRPKLRCKTCKNRLKKTAEKRRRLEAAKTSASF